MLAKVITTSKWESLADNKTIDKVSAALKANNINVFFANDEQDAKKKVLDLIPKGSEVLTVSSVTVDSLEISNEIQESGKYTSVKKKLMSMDRTIQGNEMQKLGAAPDYVIGSVHAITESGQVVVASNSGSQLPAYSYGASHVIWVVGTHKIVKDLDEAMKRINEYTLPLESERAKKAYGVPGSNVSKLLIFNKEPFPNRISVVFLNKKIGY